MAGNIGYEMHTQCLTCPNESLEPSGPVVDGHKKPSQEDETACRGCFLESPDITWREPEEDHPRTYQGSARDYTYQGEGRFIRQRVLSIMAKMDDDHLATEDPRGTSPDGRWDLNVDASDLPSPSSTCKLYGIKGLSDGIAASLHGSLPSDDSMRLLEILPDSENNIKCLLYEAHVSDFEGKYEALSYTARENDLSNESPKEIICCNGSQITISKHLAEALKRLRLPARSRFVWAVGLCVNPNDVAERNNQLRLMPSIFQNARRVIVWLGPDMRFRDKMAFQGFNGICRVINSWRARTGFAECLPHANFLATDLHLAQSASSHQDATPISSASRDWIPIMELFGCRWFGRTWSIPEVALASSAVVLWGECQISWNWIGLAAAIVRAHYGKIYQWWRPDWSRAKHPVVDIGILNAYLMYRVSLSQLPFRPLRFTFHQLLMLTRNFGCNDERDRVYSLLGLPTLDDVSSGFIPNYSHAFSSIYHEVACKIIMTSQSLSLLSDAQQSHPIVARGRRYNDPDGNVPSWVPLWHYHVVEGMNPPQTSPDFSASAGLPSNIMPFSDYSKLTVRGMIVDTVKSNQAISWKQFWRGEQGMYGPQKSLDALLSAAQIKVVELQKMAMTLTCGKSWDGSPVSNTVLHGADYARCLLKDGMRWSLEWIKCQHGTSSVLESQAEVTTLATLGQMSFGGNADRFLDAMSTMCHSRAIFATQSGLLGVGPDAMSVGDKICVLYGAEVPFVIRPQGQEYVLIGGCYIGNIMHGEAVGCGLQEDWISLV